MNKNKKLLDSFVEYCKDKPELRFWQALRNWSGFNFILKADSLIHLDDIYTTFKGIEDTFNFKNKND